MAYKKDLKVWKSGIKTYIIINISSIQLKIMKFTILLAALAATASAIVTRSVYHLDTARDATVAYNTLKNPDGSFEALTPLGGQSTLTTFKSDDDYRRILLGFDLPQKVKDPSRITSCTLHVPVPKDAPSQDYGLTAYTASSNWEEDTVDGGTKLTSIYELSSITVKKGQDPGSIDV
ncbi:hypothetical protein GGI21_001967 [Coemansia aciculifera]|nr:hypothetical protein GGI21_001967 [Coemansia aciculifera]